MKSKAKGLRGIGERLAQLRSERGLTQKEMAKALGISLNTYIRTESGERPIDASDLEKISEMGVGVTWLLTGRDEASPRPARLDHELMACIMEGLDGLHKSEGQPLMPHEQGRKAAELYDSLITIDGQEARRGALQYALEQMRRTLRRPAADGAPDER